MIYGNILFIAVSTYLFTLSDNKYAKISYAAGCVTNLLAVCLYVAARQ